MTESEDMTIGSAQSDDIILTVKNLKTYYPIYGGLLKRKIGEVKAVDGVSFNLYKQETLGLVGESGCGKTTIGNTILNLVPATAGEIWYKNQRIDNDFNKELRKKIQMVFQDPDSSLNPRWKVVNIIGEPLRLLMGMKAGIRMKYHLLTSLRPIMTTMGSVKPKATAMITMPQSIPMPLKSVVTASTRIVTALT